MKEREYILSLYEIYSNLLNEKERHYFEDYYFEDYSLQEIADNNDVSRAYVSKYINSIESKLVDFEKALMLLEKRNKIKEVLEDLDEETRNKIIELL